MGLQLRKSLHGLKKAPRLWYLHIDEFLRSFRLRRCEYDTNVYLSASRVIADQTNAYSHLANRRICSGNRYPIILLLYVDDMLLFSPSAYRIGDL